MAGQGARTRGVWWASDPAALGRRGTSCVPPLWLLLASLLSLIAGLCWPLLWSALAPLGVYALGLGLSVLLAAGVAWVWSSGWGRHRRWVPLVWCLALGALGTHVAALRHTWQLQQALNPVLEGVDLQVQGVVRGLPDSAPQAWRFELEVDAASRAGAVVRLPPRLRLNWYFRQDMPQLPPLASGERWALTVRLRAPHGAVNPSGFDTELWAWQRGIGALGYVRDVPAPQRLETAPWGVARLRQALRDQVLQTVPDARQAGVLAALLVGDQAAIDRSDWGLYRDTGVAHLMAISGLHITLFAWLATALVRGAWRGLAPLWPAGLLRWPAPRAAAWCGLALAALYALLAGWEVPAQRTVLMLLVAVALRQSGRVWPGWLQWLLVLLAVLLLDPMAPAQAGFWLSFVAVGLLWLGGSPARQPASPSGTEAAGPRRAVGALWGLWREQWLITLGLTPLTLLLFGQWSWVALLANVLAIPWVTWVITPLTLLGAAWPSLWSAAAAALALLHAVLEPMLQWPLAVSHWPSPPWPWAVLAVCGGAVMVGPWPRRWRACGVLCVLPVLLWQPVRPLPGTFEVLVLDVGQGGGTVVRTAHHSLLYDSGPRWNAESDAGERVVVPLLRAQGERLDAVVLSHSDSDHSGGSDAVRRAQARAWWLASFMGPGHQRCEAGQRWQWDGVDFAIVHPQASDYRHSTDGDWTGRLPSNAMSCVLRISVGEVAVWLGGDIDSERELRLALQQPQQATAMLAPHHGSHSSSSPALLNTLRPQQVWVQAGYRNRYGHPSPQVRQHWAERGLVPIETTHCGAITWRSDAPATWACERQRRLRFWHHRVPSAPE